jgi:sarcosine oxidase subunit gamma
MSNAVSALQGAVAKGEVTVRAAGLQGMITLRGDLQASKLRSVCKAVTGATFPGVGQVTMAGDTALAWMSPDEMLLLVPHHGVADAIAKIDKALAGHHYLAENLSDARALIFVEGTFAREVMAKNAPVDLHPDTFKTGDFRRTRLGQVAAAFWMKDADTFAVICFRSVADYTFKLLAAGAKGGAVGHF